MKAITYVVMTGYDENLTQMEIKNLFDLKLEELIRREMKQEEMDLFLKEKNAKYEFETDGIKVYTAKQSYWQGFGEIDKRIVYFVWDVE